MTNPNVSDTATWLPTGYGVIADALLNVGAIDEDELGNIPGPMYQSAEFKMNSMVKAWITSGIHVWTEEEAILFLQPGQALYRLGGSTTDKCCDAVSYAVSGLYLPASTGATSVTLQAATGFVSGNEIGVVLDTGFTFWTTVSGVPSGNTVPLAAALPSSASNGNLCYSFAPSAQIIRPLKIPRSRTLQWQGLIENPMTILSRQEYMDLPNKNSPGVPTQWFYNPGRDQGQYFAWNVASGPNYAARFTWYRPIYDFNTPLNTPDLPVEWSSALTWNLSRELMPAYGVPLAARKTIEDLADRYLEAAITYDREDQPIQFGLDYTMVTQD